MAEGRCFRLWSEAEQAKKVEIDPPECFRVDLSGAVLNLCSWGVADPEEFRWLDRPDLWFFSGRAISLPPWEPWTGRDA